MSKEAEIVNKLTANFDRIKAMLSGQQDIVAVIKEDHKPLKELLAIMKDSDTDLSKRKQAFSEFAPLLLTHAKAEEIALYDFMKTERELRQSAFEGDTEHGLADQMCEEIKRTEDVDQLAARIKVLAELVEHHIQEEENTILPKVQANSDAKTLMALTETYIKVQSEIIAEGQNDAPPEADLKLSPSAH